MKIEIDHLLDFKCSGLVHFGGGSERRHSVHEVLKNVNSTFYNTTLHTMVLADEVECAFVKS